MHELMTIAESPPTDDGFSVELHPWQIPALLDVDRYANVYIITGRGAGKSHLDAPRVIRWSEMATDLHWGIFANTEAQLHTVLAPIREALDAMGVQHCYERQAPTSWAKVWRREGILTPPQRLRNLKFWIWEDGSHFYTGALVNNAYTRAKSLNFNGILVQEGTEPGVAEAAIDTLIGCLRCGRATKQPNGRYLCTVPGHLHQLVFNANVPLNDPSHWIRKKIRRLRAQEAKRREKQQASFFILIQATTQDNPSTGDRYLDTLAASFDERTYIEQTTGNLDVEASALTYYAFSETENVHPVAYGNTRPLHMWFDFNYAMAAVGWGHDLRLSEVPEAFRPKPGQKPPDYFGVCGELFSDGDVMHTDQVARALLEDPTERMLLGEHRCRDCHHFIHEHIAVPRRAQELCTACNTFCEGAPLIYGGPRQYIHASSNWRGLLNHRGHVYVYGDASGKAEHAASVSGSSLQILRDIFGEALGERVSFRFKEANPPIKLREAAVNRSLGAKNGVRSLFFDPVCEAHIADLREVVPDPNTGTAKKVSMSNAVRKSGDEYWKRTHCMDGLGYHHDYRWPFIIPRASGLPGMPDDPDFGPLDVDFPRP